MMDVVVVEQSSGSSSGDQDLSGLRRRGPDADAVKQRLFEQSLLVNQRPLADLRVVPEGSGGVGYRGCSRRVGRPFVYKDLRGKACEVNNRPYGFRPSTPVSSSGLSSCKFGRDHWSGALRFSSSYFPSPLDRIRTGKRERAVQLGLQPTLESSFEANQSFPRANATAKKDFHEITDDLMPKGGESLSKFQGVELDSYCFSGTVPPSCKRAILNSNDSTGNHNDCISTDTSCVHSLLSGSNAAALSVGSPICSPLKAVVVVDAKTLKIVMVNDIACNLFKLPSESLCTRRLNELFVRFGRGPEALAENLLENTSGQVVLISGKVLEALTSTGEVVPVSLWMRKLESSRKPNEPTCLAVMEIVQRITANVSFNEEGEIVRNDLIFAKLLGYDIPENLIGLNIREIIPSITIPHFSKENSITKEHKRQYCTGRTREGVPFPLRILVEPQRETCDVDKTVKQVSSKSKGSVVCNSIIENSSSDNENENLLAENASHSSDDLKNSIYKGCVWVFANISGMITLLPDGEIHSCNHYFANMLFGYSQKQLIGKNISYLIPSFYDDLKFLDAEGALFPHFEEEGLEDEDSMVYDELSLSAVVASNDLSEHLDSVHLHELSHISENDSFLVQSDDNHLEVVTGSRSSLRETNVESNCDGEDCVDKDDQHSWCVDKVPNTQDINGNPTEKESKPKDDFDISEEDKCNNIGVSKDHTNEQSVPTSPNVQKPVDILLPKEEYNSPSPPFPSPPSPIEQTEFSKKNLSFKPCHNDFADKPPRILEGSFFGSGRHQDGSELAIVYQVRMVELDDGQVLFCMWVSRDPDEPAEWYRDNSSIGMLSGFNSIYDVSAFNVCNKEEEERVNSRNSVLHKSDDYSLMDCSRGVYSVHYTTLHQIGKGAFGCVKLAFRNMDKSLVVTKFISKEKVYKECWVNDNNLQKMVPLEVSLLMTLEHPNIIKVLDVYENDNYFQMVMEKHGCGTDLFDFIDRSPNLDEPLASYIFRQIVSAVSYLHGLNILHRDIKDENVIIDHEFHIKLIDFGSATFMSPNRTFSTFCGTFEYCSPEVLNGEKYRGPELEMWSLGVTLYTLVYGENPFRDIEETIQADLQFPFPLSFDLMRLITKMLHPDPNLRCTLRELETNSWLCQPVDIDCYLFENVVQCTKCQEYELFT